MRGDDEPPRAAEPREGSRDSWYGVEGPPACGRCPTGGPGCWTGDIFLCDPDHLRHVVCCCHGRWLLETSCTEMSSTQTSRLSSAINHCRSLGCRHTFSAVNHPASGCLTPPPRQSRLHRRRVARVSGAVAHSKLQADRLAHESN